MNTVPNNPASRLSVVLSYGFRPFFFAAATWAAIAICLWIAMLTTSFSIPTRFVPLMWHIHEMFFGFVLAAVAGFLLTAIANWTGRPPVSGALLGLLAVLWLLGRIASLISLWLPAWLAIAVDLAFPIALAAVAAREIIAANNRRNFPIIAPLLVLAAADLLLDLGMAGFGTSGYGWRLALTAVLILISVVGGRIIPAFTRNWLVSRRESRLPGATGWADRASLGVLHAALVAWVFYPAARPVGAALLAGAALNLWRLFRWRGTATRAEALLAVLHIGYAWLVLGVAALGVAVLDTTFPLSAAIHALTVGAIGTMILAVMTRVSRGHTGRELSADGVTMLIYALVTLAAAVRIAAALTGGVEARDHLLVGAAVLWIGAFGLFALRYAPFLLGPRKRPVLVDNSPAQPARS